MVRDTGKLHHMCSASLVSPGVILTAAHCFHKDDEIYEYDNDFAGRYREQREVSEGYKAVLGKSASVWAHDGDGDRHVVGVKKIVVGEPFEYRRGSAFWDLALVFLETCQTHNPVKIFTGAVEAPKNVTVVGFGDTETHCVYEVSAADEVDDMSKMEYSIVDCEADPACSKHGGTFCTSETICMRRRGKASCNGDSGAPIFYPSALRPGEHLQVGILSGGELDFDVFSGESSFVDHARAVRLPNYTSWLKHWLRQDTCLERVEDVFVDEM
ncbi:hypothetical protein HOP50_16g77630 [Chloropicon primus]|uniref:Peptidase S1 domain-containing protein n=1 Tax=Chloropicon primus TaxID=1764295 RepID=A0A5B8MXF9_9CHLO|nr:hypothetical protein A3770_16p77350 [Chloropicon primus]UPR04422.1 hypothetical protein HOP50_16g77630 [Chloropicon primus]|eukprot:QDZ25217.1 hypothetical protein A3770_16p77350 [Chloropicon primus]